MRAIVLLLILALAVIAVTIALLAKPLEAPLVIDAQSPGAWPKYASAPIMPGLMLCRPMLIGDASPRPIVRT